MQENFPVPEPIPSGNGLPCMDFLERELIPMIETEYRADEHDRTLLGHSLGANVALYTLFRKPGLFPRAVVASFDPLLDHEEAFAAEHAALPVRLHLVFGRARDPTEDPSVVGKPGSVVGVWCGDPVRGRKIRAGCRRAADGRARAALRGRAPRRARAREQR